MGEVVRSTQMSQGHQSTHVLEPYQLRLRQVESTHTIYRNIQMQWRLKDTVPYCFDSDVDQILI